MIPSHIAFVERLPTSVGGKLDRTRLPAAFEFERPSGNQHVPPRNAIEAKIENQTIDAFRFNLLPHRSRKLAEMLTDLIDLHVQSFGSRKELHSSRRLRVAQPQRIIFAARIDPIFAATPGHIGVWRHHLRRAERAKRHDFAFAVAFNRHGYNLDIVDKAEGV